MMNGSSSIRSRAPVACNQRDCASRMLPGRAVARSEAGDKHRKLAPFSSHMQGAAPRRSQCTWAAQESLEDWLAEGLGGALAPSAQANCYGCGAKLQTDSAEAAGYVELERYEVKRRHRQLDQLLCGRCQELSNGAMIPAVADFAQCAERATGFAGKALITPEQLREELRVVQQQKALVVLLVDLLDASGSILGRVRELVGGNPIMLVGTKADLLPAGTDLAAVADWLQAAAEFKRISAASVHLISSRTGAGMAVAAGYLRRERRGRDVFVVGAANVGKSAFIRALVKDMARMSSRQYDPAALDKVGCLPVESAMPGTTLRTIPLQVFAAGGTLYDTPGLHLHHRTPHLLTPDENKQLHPRKRLVPFVSPAPADVAAGAAAVSGRVALGNEAAAEELDGGAAVASYWWGGLARIDVLSCPADTRLVFYAPPALHVVALPGGRGLLDAPAAAVQSARLSGPAAVKAVLHDAALAAQSGSGPGQGSASDQQSFGAESVAARGGMRVAKLISLVAAGRADVAEAVADVAVSGVPGWVAVYASGRPEERVELRVLAPRGVEVYSRPALPVPSPLQ